MKEIRITKWNNLTWDLQNRKYEKNNNLCPDFQLQSYSPILEYLPNPQTDPEIRPPGPSSLVHFFQVDSKFCKMHNSITACSLKWVHFMLINIQPKC